MAEITAKHTVGHFKVLIEQSRARSGMTYLLTCFSFSFSFSPQRHLFRCRRICLTISFSCSIWFSRRLANAALINLVLEIWSATMENKMSIIQFVLLMIGVISICWSNAQRSKRFLTFPRTSPTRLQVNFLCFNSRNVKIKLLIIDDCVLFFTLFWF